MKKLMVVFVSALFFLGLGMTGLAEASIVSFILPYQGVDDTSLFQVSDNIVPANLGSSFTILGGMATVTGYFGTATEDISQRALRGIGVIRGENDEIDSQLIEQSERIEIDFVKPAYFNLLEVRSLFKDEDWGGTEQGAIDFYYSGSSFFTQGLTGVELPGSNGVLSISYPTPKLVDKLVFYVPLGLGEEDIITLKSEFAVAQLDMTVIPEPTSMLLLGMGVIGLFGLKRKRS